MEYTSLPKGISQPVPIMHITYAKKHITEGQNKSLPAMVL